MKGENMGGLGIVCSGAKRNFLFGLEKKNKR